MSRQRPKAKAAAKSKTVSKVDTHKTGHQHPVSHKLTKGQRFADIDRRYALEPFLDADISLLPAEQTRSAFIESYRIRLPVDHPFREDLADKRLAPDTLMELAKDFMLFDFAWKLEKLHTKALREREQHDRLEHAKALSQDIKQAKREQHEQALKRQKMRRNPTMA